MTTQSDIAKMRAALGNTSETELSQIKKRFDEPEEQLSAVEIMAEYMDAEKNPEATRLLDEKRAIKQQQLEFNRAQRELKEQYMRERREQSDRQEMGMIGIAIGAGIFFTVLGLPIMWIFCLGLLVLTLMRSKGEDTIVSSQTTIEEMIAADEDIARKYEYERKYRKLRNAAALGAGYYAGKKTSL